MFMRWSIPNTILLGFAAGLSAAPAVAEILRLPGQSPQVLRSERQPERGMSQSRVIALLGEPARRYPAVGVPPITRWDYPGLSVFFEHRHVIHTVIDAPPSLR